MTMAQSEFCISLAFFSFPLLPLYILRRISHQHWQSTIEINASVVVTAVIFCTTNAIIINWSHGVASPHYYCYAIINMIFIQLSSTNHYTYTIKHIICCLSPAKACSSKNRPPFITDWRTPLPLLLSFFVSTPSSFFIIHFPSLFG